MDFILFMYRELINFITVDGLIKVCELGLATWGCCIAFKGLKTWRTQIIEQPKIELARDIVEQFNDIKDLISEVRCPLISFSIDEVRKFYNKENLTESQCGLAYRLMILDRAKEQIQAFQKLRNKAKLFYSEEIEKCFFEVNGIINRLRDSCCTMIKDENILSREANKEYADQLSDIVYEHGKKDPINLKLMDVINEIEYNLRPVYEPKTIKWNKLITKKKEKEDDK